MESVDWTCVVDRVNETILQTIQRKTEISRIFKSTSLFIDGLIDTIISYADFEKIHSIVKYNYCLYGSPVGLHFQHIAPTLVEEDGDVDDYEEFLLYYPNLDNHSSLNNEEDPFDSLSLSRFYQIGLHLRNECVDYNHKFGITAGRKQLSQLEMTNENIVNLFSTVYRYETENRFFDFYRWGNCKTISNPDDYFFPRV